MQKIDPPLQDVGFQNRLNNLAVTIYKDNDCLSRISALVQTGFLAIISVVVVATIPVFISMNFIRNSITFNPIKGFIQLKNDLKSSYDWGKQCALLTTATVFGLLSFGFACIWTAQFLENKNFAFIKALPYWSEAWVAEHAPKLLGIVAELSEKDVGELTKIFPQLKENMFYISHVLTTLPKQQAVEMATTLARLPKNSIDEFSNLSKPYALTDPLIDQLSGFFEYSNTLLTLQKTFIEELKDCKDVALPASLFVRLPENHHVRLYHNLIQLGKFDIEPFTRLAAFLKTFPNPRPDNMLAHLSKDHLDKLNRLVHSIKYPFIFGSIMFQLQKIDSAKFIDLLLDLPELQAIALLNTIVQLPTTIQSIEFITNRINNCPKASLVTVATALDQIPSDVIPETVKLIAKLSTSKLILFAEIFIELKERNFLQNINTVNIAVSLVQLPETKLTKARAAGLLNILQIIKNSWCEKRYRACLCFIEILALPNASIHDLISKKSQDMYNFVDVLCVPIYTSMLNDQIRRIRKQNIDTINTFSSILACFINTDSRTIAMVLKEHSGLFQQVIYN